MNKLYAALLLCIGGVAQAAPTPVTIDFDEEGPLGDGSPTYFGLETWQENNFSVTSNVPDGTLVDNNNLVRANLFAPGTGTNSQSLFWGENGATSTVTITNDGGFRFGVNSIDASSLYAAAGELTVTGYLVGGGSISQVLTLSSDITTYGLSGFTNYLTSLELSFDGSTYATPYDLDNISLNVIPIPAAVWLFGSALGLLGWRFRAKR